MLGFWGCKKTLLAFLSIFHRMWFVMASKVYHRFIRYTLYNSHKKRRGGWWWLHRFSYCKYNMFDVMQILLLINNNNCIWCHLHSYMIKNPNAPSTILAKGKLTVPWNSILKLQSIHIAMEYKQFMKKLLTKLMELSYALTPKDY